jgi:hypothetical protein
MTAPVAATQAPDLSRSAVAPAPAKYPLCTSNVVTLDSVAGATGACGNAEQGGTQ